MHRHRHRGALAGRHIVGERTMSEQVLMGSKWQGEQAAWGSKQGR